MKKTVFLGLVVILLTFGFISCSDDGDSYNNDPGEYAGTWTGNIMGASGTVTVSNAGWTLSVPSLWYGDTGNFNRNGNTATLYSIANERNVGTVTFTSSTTGQIVLNGNSGALGTYTINKL